ncbi:hypothetical protein AA0472_0243 [Acetobacter estunensis NRIC 0472]|uniref:NTP transferase domain-containing protein n=1 Tax=Acetobacter estunensis TaxID=104097 RepID=A0A967B5F1_9PROT|nr:nucleotidyltransferase family protein [Acetobacter estunensis]NHO54125.1 NTP transferase domain-containing protein [Acetobacter estunensis]GBQ20786.1 hypothetical protein AA0472_0243 [Acetobacter estunensis NRIC 0472]
MKDESVAIVLAAGRSSRSGNQHKLLAQDAAGQTMLARTLTEVLGSRVGAVCVVLAPDGEGLLTAVYETSPALRIPERRLDICVAPDAREGLSASLRAGVKWAESRHACAALICLADMPLVRTGVMDDLLTRYRLGGVDVVVPEHDGRMGNPVVWGAACFPALQTVEGDRGGRVLLRSTSLRQARVAADAGVLEDFDTPEALERFAACQG